MQSVELGGQQMFELVKMSKVLRQAFWGFPGSLTWSWVLLPHIWSSCSYLLHPVVDNSGQQLNMVIWIFLQKHVVVWYVTFTRNTHLDHHSLREFRLHGTRDFVQTIKLYTFCAKLIFIKNERIHNSTPCLTLLRSFLYLDGVVVPYNSYIKIIKDPHSALYICHSATHHFHQVLPCLGLAPPVFFCFILVSTNLWR